jgi:hypothetical protein
VARVGEGRHAQCGRGRMNGIIPFSGLLHGAGGLETDVYLQGSSIQEEDGTYR